MPPERRTWAIDGHPPAVLAVTDALLGTGTVRPGGRMVATASIAGDTGQANYAASRAGIIGTVRSLAPRAAAEHGVTVNAVAPGFIETRMTAAVPFLIEAGRRMNCRARGGLPVDVAEATAHPAHPGSGPVNGQGLCVRGQSLLGA